MGDPLTLFILVAVGERTELTRAMASATQDALGASGHVVVREITGEPNDAQALAVERSENANVVVELFWTDARHQQASLRIRLGESRRWVERSIGFVRADADAERGRTIGFAIASILPRFPGAPVTEGPPPAVLVPASARAAEGEQPPPTTAPASSSQQSEPGRPDMSGSRASRAPLPDSAPPAKTVGGRAKRPDVAVDVLGVAAKGIAGDADGLGGAAALQWFFLRPLSVRLGASLMAGNLAAAQASTLTVVASAGAVVHIWRASAPHAFGASIRAEYLWVDESLTHFAAGGASPKWFNGVSGVGVAADLAWRLAPDVEFVLGGGFEDVFAPIYIDVQHRRKATIPPLRAVVEAGVRLDL